MTIGSMIGMIIDAAVGHDIPLDILEKGLKKEIELIRREHEKATSIRIEQSGDMEKNIQRALKKTFHLRDFVSTREIHDAIGLTGKIRTGEAKKIAKEMRALGWNYTRVRRDQKQQRGWVKPCSCAHDHEQEYVPKQTNGSVREIDRHELLRITRDKLNGDLRLLGRITAGRLKIELGLQGEMTNEILEEISSIMLCIGWRRVRVQVSDNSQTTYERLPKTKHTNSTHQ